MRKHFAKRRERSGEKEKVFHPMGHEKDAGVQKVLNRRKSEGRKLRRDMRRQAQADV